MDLAWLEDYLALADALNFSRAAEARHVTQPAFSRRIRALEAWVGAPLFSRSTHSVALTPAGVHFHAQALVLTRMLLQLQRDTRDVAARDAGHVSIAATHALSFTFFPRWVRSNDKVLALGNLNLISDSMQACERMMLRGDARFLLCHTHPDMELPLGPAQFTSMRVGTDALVPLCAPDSHGAPRWWLQAGARVRYLAYSAPSGLGRIIGTQHATTTADVVLDTVFTSHLAATLLSMARAGDGVAWLPRTLAEDDIAAGRLVEAGPAELALPVDIRLFRPVARLNRAAEAVWEAFRPR